MTDHDAVLPAASRIQQRIAAHCTDVHSAWRACRWLQRAARAWHGQEVGAHSLGYTVAVVDGSTRVMHTDDLRRAIKMWACAGHPSIRGAA